jgi:hypothetical protein
LRATLNFADAKIPESADMGDHRDAGS